MAVSQRGTGDSFQILNSGATSGTLDKDTGTASGDLILILASWFEGNNNWNVNTPSGFTAYTQIALDTSGGVGESRIALFTRVADGSEGSTYSVSFTGSTSLFTTVSLLTLTGGGALSVASVTNGSRATGTTITVPSVSGTSGQCLVAPMGYSDPATVTQPGGWTQGTRGLQNTNTGEFWFKTLSSTGATGTAAFTLSTSRDNAAYAVLVDEAGGGVTATPRNNLMLFGMGR